MNMIKKIILGILGVILWSNVFAEIPVGYYNSINGKKNRELKTALHRILAQHTRLDYDDMWYYWRTTDNRGNNVVWDMYSNNTRYFRDDNWGPSGMDREHSLPKSWWAEAAYVRDYAAHDDINHLYPSDRDANAAKLNYILGETNNPSWTNQLSKVGSNSFNYTGSPSVTCFEPGDQYKGDFARTYMYMVTCYEDYASLWRSEASQMFNREIYPVFKPWAREMLLKWHRDDPVSQKEIDRNRYVHIYQNNRNPFIDFPQLAEYIWGDSVDYEFKVPEEFYAKDPVLITPVKGTSLYFGEVRPMESSLRILTIKGDGLTENLSIDVYGKDAAYFKLPVRSIPMQQANSESGYDLHITYTPTSTGQHNAGFVVYDGGIKGGGVSVSLTGICSETASIIPVGVDFPDLYADNGEIVFRAYQPGTKIHIYNILGKLVYTDICTGVWQNYSTAQPGIYIVNINETTQKILVK